MSFQAGQKVRILDPLPEGYITVVESMRRMAGQIVTIDRRYRNDRCADGYEYYITGSRCVWESIAFEKIMPFEVEEDEDIPDATFGGFFKKYEVS